MINAKKITTSEEFENALRIRIEVFVNEQGVPLEDELDEHDTLDGETDHILAYFDGKPVGAARLRTVGTLGKLERIVVLKPFRGLGAGKTLVETLERLARGRGLKKVKLHGQVHAETFYEALGFSTSSAPFEEDGIMHVEMVKGL